MTCTACSRHISKLSNETQEALVVIGTHRIDLYDAVVQQLCHECPQNVG